MNIPKAIELLLSQEIKLKTASDHDHYKAILLGVQALKRVEDYRQFDELHCKNPLPGETED